MKKNNKKRAERSRAEHVLWYYHHLVRPLLQSARAAAVTVASGCTLPQQAVGGRGGASEEVSLGTSYSSSYYWAVLARSWCRPPPTVVVRAHWLLWLLAARVAAWAGVGTS